MLAESQYLLWAVVCIGLQPIDLAVHPGWNE